MKLLIAEDDVDLNGVIVKKMRAEGFETDTVFDGEEALEHLLFAGYDAAVLDIMMPGLDGTEVVRKMRAEGILTPVIFLTARDSIADRVRGLNIGANDYVVKPFSFDELIARIYAVTRTASGNTSSVIRVSGLSLDMDAKVVRRDGREIHLSAREYALLEYMMLNKSRVLSREKIVNHVWGYDYEGGMNIVDVYMNYLRKKIDEGYSEKLIRTVRGIGYTMRPES